MKAKKSRPKKPSTVWKFKNGFTLKFAGKAQEEFFSQPVDYCLFVGR